MAGVFKVYKPPNEQLYQVKFWGIETNNWKAFIDTFKQKVNYTGQSALCYYDVDNKIWMVDKGRAKLAYQWALATDKFDQFVVDDEIEMVVKAQTKWKEKEQQTSNYTEPEKEKWSGFGFDATDYQSTKQQSKSNTNTNQQKKKRTSKKKTNKTQSNSTFNDFPVFQNTPETQFIEAIVGKDVPDEIRVELIKTIRNAVLLKLHPDKTTIDKTLANELVAKINLAYKALTK